MFTDLIKDSKHRAVPTGPQLANTQSMKQEATQGRLVGVEELPRKVGRKEG